MGLLQSLLRKIKEKYSRVFFKPIDATRHLSGEQLELFLEISSRRSNVLTNELTLWEEAEDRSFASLKKPKEDAQHLFERLRLKGVSKPALVEFVVKKDSKLYKEDGSLDVEAISEYFIEKKFVEKTKKSKYIGIGMFRRNYETIVTVLFGQ